MTIWFHTWWHLLEAQHWIDSPFLAQVTYTCVSISAGGHAACSATPLPGTDWRITCRALKSTSDWPKRSLRSPTHEAHPRNWSLAANANGFTTRRAGKPGGKRIHASRTFGCTGELSSTSSAWTLLALNAIQDAGGGAGAHAAAHGGSLVAELAGLRGARREARRSSSP